jgi:SAM-dependent methyltransferase
VGCGDSSLCRGLSADGFEAVGTDLASSACVLQRDALTRHSAAPPPSFIHCNASHLPFAPASFDAAVDKGTIDAILCSPDGLDGQARGLLAEVGRVVRSGGLFVSVSYAEPSERSGLLLQCLGSDWEVTTHRLPRVTRNDFTGRRFNYVYMCHASQGGKRQKTAPRADAREEGEEEEVPTPAVHRKEAGGGGRQEEAGEMDVKLLMATIAEAVDEVMWLLDNGACPRSTASNLHGTTPSMVAAGAGSLTSLRLLAGRAGLRHVCWARDLLGQVALHHVSGSRLTAVRMY